MTEFEKLFESERVLVFKYLLKLTHDASLAEELTQETFFRAYMNYSGVREKDKVSAWLCRIARNTYFAWYNEYRRMIPIENVESVSKEYDMDNLFIQKELSMKALECLHELEEPYKEVFMLSIFAGFSLKYISKVFGKSESWARVTVYRAKQKIVERMRKTNEL